MGNCTPNAPQCWGRAIDRDCICPGSEDEVSDRCAALEAEVEALRERLDIMEHRLMLVGVLALEQEKEDGDGHDDRS